MSDDSQSDDDAFSGLLEEREKSRVSGLVKVPNVVKVDVGEEPLPHEIPTDQVETEPQTMWLTEGDSFTSYNEELGTFKIVINKVVKVTTKSSGEVRFQVEAKHQPVDDVGVEDDNENRTPLYEKQSIRAFAQEAANYEAQGEAGLPPEEREAEVEVIGVAN